jgi:hypothetical protein
LHLYRVLGIERDIKFKRTKLHLLWYALTQWPDVTLAGNAHSIALDGKFTTGNCINYVTRCPIRGVLQD